MVGPGPFPTSAGAGQTGAGAKSGTAPATAAAGPRSPRQARPAHPLLPATRPGPPYAAPFDAGPPGYARVADVYDYPGTGHSPAQHRHRIAGLPSDGGSPGGRAVAIQRQPAVVQSHTTISQPLNQRRQVQPLEVLHPHPESDSSTPQSHGGEAADAVGTPAGPHAKLGTRIVPDPPHLDAWREILFGVDGRIVLTNDQFETYFPHVDNVYSHRSTQRYKRKPFVSHYWDCRMKGRPPGTPKSDDPNKKKRKRTVRERDLCDVKVKITEYFSGAQITPEGGDADISEMPSHLGLLSLMDPITVCPGQRLWTIQRVNGNGNNGKGDGVAGPHKHTLAKSDEIKKNSVQRQVGQQTRGAKKPQQQKPSQWKATGSALATVRKHSKDSELKLFAACFCPFSQRVWIALEAKGLSYQYCEIDPYQKPSAASLIKANPRGLVPAIHHNGWACTQSAVILEYLEDINSAVPLNPTDPRLKAKCRLWVDHINTHIVPAFFALLKTPETSTQAEHADRLQRYIASVVLAADEQGPFFLGSSLSLVDIHLAPFALRLSRMLPPLRSLTGPPLQMRWQSWLEALEADVHVQATMSLNELYTETVELLKQNGAIAA